jgi:hypothetical protein
LGGHREAKKNKEKPKQIHGVTIGKSRKNTNIHGVTTGKKRRKTNSKISAGNGYSGPNQTERRANS